MKKFEKIFYPLKRNFNPEQNSNIESFSIDDFMITDSYDEGIEQDKISDNDDPLFGLYGQSTR